LAETGAPSQPSLGLTVERVDPALARQLNLDDTAGVLVAEVDPGGPGAAAGLRPRDIILEVDRQPVKNLDSWRRALDRAAGEKITLLLVRRDHGTIFITLRERG
jgi:serine protease Do